MQNWYQIENKKDSAEILIYEQIGQGFDGSGLSAKKFVEDLQALDVSDIDLHINSPGGNVFDGNAIYNALKTHKARINVKIDGLAASIASVVAMAGDTVEMPENAMMMIHDPSGLVIGQAEAMRKMADVLEKLKGTLVSAYRNKSKLNDDEISAMMTAETWMSAKEAKDKGFADQVTPRVEIQASFNGSILSHFKCVPQEVRSWTADIELSALNAQLKNKSKTGSNNMDKNLEERAKAEWDKDPALRAEFRGNFDTFLAYAEGIAEGRVKIISGTAIKG